MNTNSLLKIIFLCLILNIFFGVFYTMILNKNDFEGKTYDGLNLKNLEENIYFSNVTMFSVGYGDIYPKTRRARFLIGIQNLICAIFLIKIISNI